MLERPDAPRRNGSQGTAPAGSAPETPAEKEELHELRVRVPAHIHRQLLSLKILRGRSLAETVSNALDIYFSDQSAAATAARTGPATPHEREHGR